MKIEKIELFNEVYSFYFTIIQHILKEAAGKDLSISELSDIITNVSETYGKSEKIMDIVLDAIGNGEKDDLENVVDAWPFFEPVLQEENDNGKCTEQKKIVSKHRCLIDSACNIPLSTLEKMWLKSLYSDSRIKLFIENEAELPDLEDIEPLFSWDDYVLFDQYSDGDPFEDDHYIEMFRRVLNGVRNNYGLEIKVRKPNNNICFNSDGSYEIEADRGIETLYIAPDTLEYSERDDRFRLIGNTLEFGRTIVKIASIESCKEVERIDVPNSDFKDGFKREAVFELIDDNNTLERFLLNFSHYEKVAEQIDLERHYRITITYDETDETDLVIRTLSFGPHIKAVAPDIFVDQVIDRLRQQMEMMKIQ